MYKKLLLIFCMILLFLPFVNAELTDDIVFYYSFDNDTVSGTNIIDLAENYNGIKKSSIEPLQIGDGILEDAVYFDGNDYIGTGVERTSEDSYTLSAWFNLASVGTSSRWIIGSGDSSSANPFFIHIDNSGHLKCTLSEQGQWGSTVNIDYGNIITNSWYFATCVFNTTSNELSFYVNGYISGSPQSVAGRCMGGYDCGNFEIGKRSYSVHPHYYAGNIDEASIWNRALNSSEILELYNSGDGYNPYPGPSPSTNFSITVTNADTFNATINGTVYETSNGTIVTGIPNNASSLYNITLDASGFFQKNFTNYNVSTDISTTLNRFTYVQVYNTWNNNSLDSYNVTIDGIVYTPDSENKTYVPYNDTKTVLISKENYISKSYEHDFSSSNLTAYLGQTVTTIQATTKYGNQNIQSFSIITEEGTFSTTNGTITIEPNKDTYYWNLSNQLYQNRTNEEFVISSTYESITLVNMSSATIQFINNQTSLPFNNASITLSYPNGATYDLYTNSSGYVEVAGQENNSNSIFNLTFNAYGGFQTPIIFPYNISTFTNESNGIDQTNIIITILDYETELPITQNVDVNIINYFSVNTSNGSINVSNISITSGEIGLYAKSDGYITTQKTFIYDNQENIRITLYLKNESIEDLGNLFVYSLNEAYYSVKGVDVRLEKYFFDDGEFKEVDQCYSNSNGECVFKIILGTERYRVTGTIVLNGEIIYAESSSTGDFFSVDNTEIELFMRFRQEFNISDDYDLLVEARNTTLVGNISYLNAYFNDPNGLSHTVCISYHYVDGLSEILVDEECTTASSGTVAFTGGKLLNRDYVYIARIYSKDSNDEVLKTYWVERYNSLTGFSEVYSDFIIPLIVVLLAVSLGLALMLNNILIFPIGCIGLTILAWVLKPATFNPFIAVSIIVINIMIIYIARKENDNEGT